MNVRVRVLDVTHVQPQLPEQTTNQPRDHAAIKLSPFDTLFLALRPIQRLFFYDDGASLPPSLALVRSLRASLAVTLVVFTPLAGKLTACSDDDVVIDYSPDAFHPGVRFVEEEYSGDTADMRRLARDVEHDMEAFLQLVPELDVRRLSGLVLAVQVTRPAGSGDGDRSAGAVAVGVSMHHASVLWTSITSVLWTSIARANSPDQAATGDDDAYFLFPADCRLRPPLDPALFGNCVKLCYARATMSDLCRNDDDALARAAAATRLAIRAHVEEEDPLGDADRWAETNRGIPRERLAQQGSSHNHGVLRCCRCRNYGVLRHYYTGPLVQISTGN